MRKLLLVTALAALSGACAPASSSTPAKPDGRAWIDVPADPFWIGHPMADDVTRIRFDRAIHRYEPATDRTIIRLGEALGGYSMRLVWTGDTPMQGGTDTGDPFAVLELRPAPGESGEPWYADDQTAPTAILRLRFQAADFATSSGERTTGDLWGQMMRDDGTLLDVLDGRVSAIRR